MSTPVGKRAALLLVIALGVVTGGCGGDGGSEPGEAPAKNAPDSDY